MPSLTPFSVSGSARRLPRVRRLLLIACAAGLGLAVALQARPGWAQSGSPDPGDEDSTETEAQQTVTVTVEAGRDGFALRSEDGEFALRLSGLLQSDARFTNEEADVADRFFLRRVRPITGVTLFGDFDVRLMPEFGQGGAGIQDAYLNADLASHLEVQAGKFKVPVGLELLQSSTNLTFIPRASVAGAVPGRDVGIMLHGTVLEGRLDYQLGVFNGTPDGQSRDGDAGDGKDVAGRLFARPLQGDDMPTLGVGIGGSIGREDGTASRPELPTYSTRLGRQPFFRFGSGVVSDGARWRLAPQAYLFEGPAGLIAEFVATRQAVGSDDLLPVEREGSFVHQAWNVTGSYLLTGEEATYGRVRPQEPFNGEDQWGAVEVAARVHGTNIDNDVFSQFASPATNASSAVAWGLGVNWHLNTNIRFVLNYEQTHFSAFGDASSRDTEQAVAARFHVAF